MADEPLPDLPTPYYAPPSYQTQRDQDLHDEPSGRKWIAVLVIFVILISIIGIGYATWPKIKAKKAEWFSSWNKREEPDSRLNQTYPLTLRAMSNGTLIAAEYLLKESNRKIQKGKLSPASIEAYPSARFNTTYSLTAFSQHFYPNTENCHVFDETEDCIVELERIATVNLTTSNDRLLIQVANGKLRKPLLCVTWDLFTHSVTFAGLLPTSIPERLRYRVDACYALQQKPLDDLVQASEFADAVWDLHTLHLARINLEIGKRLVNATLNISGPGEPISWESVPERVKFPEETVTGVNQSALRFYEKLEENRDLYQDIEVPFEIENEEGKIVFWLLDLGDDGNFEATYEDDERYGLPDINLTMVLD